MTGVVDAIEIANERFEKGTDFEQLMPVLRGTCETGNIDAQDETDMVEADLSYELLEAQSSFDRSCRLTEVIINDENAFFGPTESDRAFDETILQAGRFLMFHDLLHGGLADVNNSEAIEVMGKNFVKALGRQIRERRLTHESPPGAAWC